MLTNEEIVYVANDWFKENKTSAHHIAEVLARRNTILYVEAAGMRAPRASKRDLRKIMGKLRRIFSGPVPAGDRFYLYSPTILPFHRIPVVRAINGILMRIMLRRACRKVGIRNPLLWIFMPHFAPAMSGIRGKGVVYYCVDEYTSQPMVDKEAIRRMERDILARADVVFVVSEELQSAKRPLNPNTYLSRHGVDVDMFAAAMSSTTEVPQDIANIRRPIAGYFGLVEEWTDLELIDHLAENLPDVSFVFVGRVACDVSRFAAHNNVHFLGQKPYDALPGYLKAFDVCMLVYKKEDFARNANPKKLREYLAGGKPVVSIRNKEIEQFADVVSIADTYQDYVQCVRNALQNDSEERVAQRIARVKTETWESRVDQISETVARHIPGTHADQGR